MVVNAIGYGIEIDLFKEDDYDTVGMDDAFYLERLAAMSAGISREAPSLQLLCARQINRELDQYDFSHYLPRAALEIIARVGKAGRRGDSKSINKTIMRIERDFAAAACRALDIELGSYPDKEDLTSTRNGELKAAKQSWYAKCPLEFIVDIANVHDPDQHVCGAFVTEMQVTVCLRATKRVTQRQGRGQGVTSQRLNLEVSGE